MQDTRAAQHREIVAMYSDRNDDLHDSGQRRRGRPTHDDDDNNGDGGGDQPNPDTTLARPRTLSDGPLQN